MKKNKEKEPRTNIYLIAKDKERAKRIGSGNVSKGIRLALEIVDKRTTDNK